MNIFDKLSIAGVGITIAAVTYGDISKDLSDVFDGLFEASASIADIELNPWKEKIRHETLYCENEDNSTCVDLLALGFAALEKKPELPLGRIPSKKQIRCLAENIYYEARGEGIDGMTAVGLVTLNRVNSSEFPNNICDVVYQTETKDGKVIAQMEWVAPNGKKVKRYRPFPNERYYVKIAYNIASGKYKTGHEQSCQPLFWLNPKKVKRNSWHAGKYYSNKIGCSFKVNNHTFSEYEA